MNVPENHETTSKPSAPDIKLQKNCLILQFAGRSVSGRTDTIYTLDRSKHARASEARTRFVAAEKPAQNEGPAE
jgi:hypothetical protein